MFWTTSDKIPAHVCFFLREETGRQADLREGHGFRCATGRISRADGAASSCVSNGVSSLLQTHPLGLEKREKHFMFLLTVN